MSTERKKKILFLITKSNWGGAQRYVFDLATELAGRYEIVVALGGEGTLKKMLDEKGIRVISIPGLQRDISFTKELTAFRALSRILKSERPDVLHVNSSKAGGVGALLGRIHGVTRIIFTAHGWAFNEDRSPLQKILVGFLHFLTIMLAHKTIAVSHGLKREMKWPFTHKRMVVIHPGRTLVGMLDKLSARNTLVSFAPTLRPHTTHTWIGTIAELHPIKRLNIAIEAIASVRTSHPNVRYVIVGGGETESDLKHQVANLGLTEHVFFTGSIPDAANILPAFDIFLLPSRSESFGYVLLEAGHAQLPVVAARVGGIPDIVEHEKGGTLVEPESSEAVATALTRYLDNPELAKEHADALHAHTVNFTTARMARDVAQLYEALR